jgi:hypothetical protein
MFGAIVCPKCNTARGVRLPSKTARCPKCGHSIDVTKAKLYFETDSQEELVEAVRALSVRLATDIEERPRPRRRRKAAKAVVAKARMNEEDVRAALAALTERSATFSRQELFETLHITKKDEQERTLDRLLASGLLFEPRPGRFKSA